MKKQLKRVKIAIVVSQFNKKITDDLLKSALGQLEKSGIVGRNIDIFYVPGAFELPYKAMQLAVIKKYAGMIALGAVIQGATDHYKAIRDGVTFGIQKVSIENRIPIMFGILMCRTEKQAIKRSVKGRECAIGLMQILEIL